MYCKQVYLYVNMALSVIISLLVQTWIFSLALSVICCQLALNVTIAVAVVSSYLLLYLLLFYIYCYSSTHCICCRFSVGSILALCVADLHVASSVTDPQLALSAHQLCPGEAGSDPPIKSYPAVVPDLDLSGS